MRCVDQFGAQFGLLFLAAFLDAQRQFRLPLFGGAWLNYIRCTASDKGRALDRAAAAINRQRMAGHEGVGRIDLVGDVAGQYRRFRA
jgi:hypothetical protein